MSGRDGVDGRHSDTIVLARLVAGDDHALSAVWDRYADLVLGIARRVTADDQLARDVAQEVFVLLWERPDRVDLERGSLRSWLAVVAHRRSVDAVRRSERRRRAETAAGSSASTAVVDDDVVADLVADADALAWSRDRLAGALDRLPDDQRTVVVLVHLEGRTFRDVAALLGIPEGTAKSRGRLGLARVRALVADELAGSR